MAGPNCQGGRGKMAQHRSGPGMAFIEGGGS
jgi:hypothetical protein